VDFGKLARVDRVDFSLPDPPAPQDRRSLAVLSRFARDPLPPAVRAGCPVWAEKKWLGKIYPVDAKPADFLHHYSRQFDLIELNVTHYRIPEPRAVEAWRDATPDTFRFCPKWPQEISHHRGLERCEELTTMFCDSISRLGSRLGSTFVQLPPGFAPPHLPALKRFLATVPRGFPICVEFRHPAWFKDHALIPAACDALEAAGAGTVITDVAGRRDVAHLSLTSSRVMIRFVGNALHPTDFTRIDAWIPRLKLWLASGLKDVAFCMHEPGNVLEPDMVSYFVERMNERVGLRMHAWKPMDQGTQISLF
jgi:uncharacterized protein YecE (DUF72 family)